MNKVFKYIVTFILFFVFFASCKKENRLPSWDIDVLTPLLKSSLSLNNLLNDTLLAENPDSSLKIAYHHQFYSFSTDSLLQIPDTTFSHVYPPFSFPLYHIDSNEIIMNNAGQSYFNMGSVYLTYAKLKAGYIRVEVYNEFKEKINVYYTIPSATKLSVPFSVTEQVPAATAAGPAIFTKTYSLAGYDIDFKGANGDKFNTIALSVIARSDDSVSIYMGDSAIFKNTYFGMEPEYARGYLGKDTLTIGPAETTFDLFKSVKSGNLLLDNASVKISIDNYTGIDSKIQLNSWYSKNTPLFSTVNLSSSIIGSTHNINRAAETAGPYSSPIPSKWSRVLDNSNSNIKALLENFPDALGYGLKIETNPLGNVSGNNDFIYTDKTIEAYIDIDVPLSLSAAGLTLIDTVDFSLQTGTQADNINYGTFTLFANNGFPFEAAVQFYMLNSNKQIVDSLFTQNKIIEAGIVDANLKVVGKKMSQLPVPLDNIKLEKLKKTNNMIVKVKYTTVSNPQLVKLYSHYSIDIKLVGDFNYSVKFD